MRTTQMICKRAGCGNSFKPHGRRAYCLACPKGRRGTCPCGARTKSAGRRCRSCAQKAKCTPDFRKRLSVAVKAAYKRPDVKTKHLAASNTPAAKAKRSAASKKNWANESYRARHRAGVKAAMACPDVRARLSVTAKAQWEDPEIRARQTAAIKAGLSRPDVKAKRSRAMKAVWQDAAFRERHRIAINRPEVKAKISAASVRMWGDPNYIKKQPPRKKKWSALKVKNRRILQRRDRLALIQAAHERAKRAYDL